jgi:DNA-binding beta-propeller fold protein YncE
MGYVFDKLQFKTVPGIDENKDVVDAMAVGDSPRALVYNPGNGYMYVTKLSSDTVSVIGVIPPPLEGSIGSRNNINILV